MRVLHAMAGTWLERTQAWLYRQIVALPEDVESHVACTGTENLVEFPFPRVHALTAQGIGMGVHYRSLAEHPYYQERFGWRPEQWPHALRIGQQTVSLPLSPGMNDGDVADVITAVRRVLRR